MTDKLFLDEAVKLIAQLDAKRTPGEWCKHGCKAECGQVWSAEADYPVAFCDTNESGEGFLQEQFNKNADIIASIPLMTRIIAEQARRLEVAREALQYYDKCYFFEDDNKVLRFALETLTSKEPCV